jgi:hypothetical protein
MKQTRMLVFYAGLLYDDLLVSHYDPFNTFRGNRFPDGAYIYLSEGSFIVDKEHWFLSDLTPVLLEDVPKEYILMGLLLR